MKVAYREKIKRSKTIGGFDMKNLESAMERIRRLECPTGEVEERILGIMESYGGVDRNAVQIKRQEDSDRDDGAQAYSANVLRGQNTSMMIYAKSGLDDYVAKVVDVEFN